ncbi:MAG: hypothetical protein K2R98_04700 [Gemmataceae bacterium]|nr:hypothetical protein [Gemmataceae bacterium]
MTRRDSILTLAAGLLGLLTGCSRLQTVSNGELLSPETHKSASPADAVAMQQPAPSPYAPVPTPTGPRVDPRELPNLTGPAVTPAVVATEPAPEPRVQQATFGERPPPAEFDPRKPLPATLERHPGPTLIPPPEAKPDPPLVGALRCLLEKRPADAMTLLKTYDKPNQEVLLAILPLMARLDANSLEKVDAREIALAIEQLETVIAPLRLRAALVLDKMCFCRKIDKYGVYEALPEGYAFRPGELVQIYVELRNFASPEHDRWFETRLASAIRLVRVDGGKEEVVYQQGFHDRDHPDLSRTQRHDYFINYRFCIKENIPPGEYKLYLRVEDVPTGRFTERALDVRLTTRPAQ